MEPSECTDSFPLDSLLRMYCIGRRILYLDHMKGMKLLIDWLGPFNYEESDKLIPWFLQNYEVNELAKLIGTNPDTICETLKDITWT